MQVFPGIIVNIVYIVIYSFDFSFISVEAAGGMTPQEDSPQGGQTYVIQHPWPGTEGPLTIKKEGVETKKVEPKKNLSADEVVVA